MSNRQHVLGAPAGLSNILTSQGSISVSKPYLSVVVPLFNEEDNVEPLYEALVAGLRDFSNAYEIILVDDGSADGTFGRARRMAESDARLKVIRFRKNFGQTPAMAAGIDYSTGDIVITMDGDLQNDPRDIPLLVAQIESGCDIAVGWRHRRQDKFVSRIIPSLIANWLIGKVTGVPIKDNGCSLKAYHGELIRKVPLYSEMHRFIPAVSTLAGAKIAQLKVRHHPRKYGESKYGLSRAYKVLFDLVAIKTITAFSPRALLWFSILALPFAALSAACSIWSLEIALLRNGSLVVASGLAVIFGGGAASLLIYGILCELVYSTGDSRPLDFLGPRRVVAFRGRGASGRERH